MTITMTTTMRTRIMVRSFRKRRQSLAARPLLRRRPRQPGGTAGRDHRRRHPSQPRAAPSDRRRLDAEPARPPGTRHPPPGRSVRVVGAVDLRLAGHHQRRRARAPPDRRLARLDAHHPTFPGPVDPPLAASTGDPASADRGAGVERGGGPKAASALALHRRGPAGQPGAHLAGAQPRLRQQRSARPGRLDHGAGRRIASIDELDRRGGRYRGGF